MLSTALTSAVENKKQIDSKSLELCIANMANGDKNALAQLYESTRVAVYGFSLSILKNAYDAQDVLQTTYIKVYEASATYIPNGKPMAFIFTVAKNLSLMKIREQKHIQDISDESWLNISSKSTQCSHEDEIVLKQTMLSLSEQEREIVTLHAIAGFKHREIADFLNLPLSTVLSKYHRAIKRLKTLLKEG
ncbi:MAG: RNA polymerase sigma factor [Oscillospiraceae bacterium]